MSHTPESTTASVPEANTPAAKPADVAETVSPAAPEAAAAAETPAATAPEAAASAPVQEPVEAAAAEEPAAASEEPAAASDDDSDLFRQMLEESLRQQPVASSGEIIKGFVVGVDREVVMIDVGGKNEGRVSASEFEQLGEELPAVGDEIEIMVQHSADRGGSTYSVIAARRNSLWEGIEASFNEQSILQGKVTKEVKGGLRVQLGGIEAFMPRSECDTSLSRQVAELVGQDVEVVVITAERRPENVVVSRKRPLEKVELAKRAEFFAASKLGDKVSGEVKRLTDFGAFVDLGGVDALLHISDIAWRRLKHPSEALQVGQKITAEIIKLNETSGKVSLSMRSLQSDPWENAEHNYQGGMRITGTVRRLLDFGAMVELEPGVEGMIHRSEMSWTRRDINPSQVLAEGDVVDVAVIEVDPAKRRIALSLKEVSENPWQAWLSGHPAGSHVSGPVRSITEFGMFVRLSEELDGLVHIGDLSWTETGDKMIAEYSKGQEVECVVLGVDIDRQRISLGIKQLESDPFQVFMDGSSRGRKVEGKVISVAKGAANVEVMEGVVARLALREVPREHDELKVGDQIEAKIIELDRKRRRIDLSISQLLRDEEKDAVRNYSKSVSGGNTMSALALQLQAKLLSKQEKAPAKAAAKPSAKAAAKPAAKAAAKPAAKVTAADKPAADEPAAKAAPKGAAKADADSSAEAGVDSGKKGGKA